MTVLYILCVDRWIKNDYFQSHVPIFKALSSIKFIDDTLPNVRKDAEKQLEAVGISDMLIKKWLVTNIIQDKTSRQFRWIFNLDAIYQAYKNKCGK